MDNLLTERRRHMWRFSQSRAVVWILRVLVVVVPVLAWQWGASVGFVDDFLYSSPARIAEAFRDWVRDGTLLRASLHTVRSAMIGYIIGTLAGIGVALLFHQKPRVAAVYMPVVTAMNAVPRIIFAPLFVLVFGYSWLGSAALVILVVLFIAFFTTYKGLASLDPVFTSWGELNGFSSWEMWRHIKFPAVVGWLTASMRTTIGISFSAAIVAEFLGMPEGLGALIQRGLLEFRPASILASLVAVALIVILIDAILRLVERTMSTWATDR